MLTRKLISASWCHWMVVVMMAAAFGAVAAQPGLADNFGLENEWCLNPSAGSTCGRSGVQQLGPLTTNVSESYNESGGASFSGAMTDISNYGNLYASGSGTATPTVGNGAIGNLGPYVGGAPVATYTDTLTITGSGPVTIQLTEVFSGSATWTVAQCGPYGAACAYAYIYDELSGCYEITVPFIEPAG